LNVFKQAREYPQKSAATRSHILTVALSLFRQKGFDETTMREIAAEAKVALGAAYYYFPSKESIVAEYYKYVQDEHLLRAREQFLQSGDLSSRLRAAIHTKLDILQGDRRLMSALFRYGGDPEHRLSWFGPETKEHRVLSTQIFAEAIAEEKLPPDLKEVAPTLLWAMHMGILLYFLYDKSPEQQHTRRLADGAVELAVQARKFVSFPMLRPLRKRVIGLLREAELVP
jgi:AcrR family transcriptional regulator